jgi:hypothetical protein
MNRFSLKALAYACHAVIWFVVIITIATELAEPVKGFLAGLTGHHWTTKASFRSSFSLLWRLFLQKKKTPVT